jgi:hypothetical protein
LIVQAFARQTITDIAINAASIYRLNFAAFLIVAAAPYAVESLIDVALGVTRPWTTEVLFLTLVLVVNTGSFVAAAHIAVHTIDGNQISVEEALAWMWRTPLLHIILATLIVALGIAAGIILLVIPGIVVAVRAAYLTFPFLYEGAGIKAALQRTNTLARGDFLHTTAILMVFGCIPYLFVPYLLALVEEESMLLLVLIIIFGAAWVPLFPIAMALGYIEMRSAKDGYLPDHLHADLQDVA